MIRAPFTRVSRSLMCLVLALAIAWALHAELSTVNIEPATRWGWAAATTVFEVVMLAGLQRIWVVGLIVNDAGLIVRNFRGDIKLRRTEVKEVFRVADFSGFHVALRLKVGDEIHLDGVTWLTPGRTERAVEEVSRALGFVQSETATAGL